MSTNRFSKASSGTEIGPATRVEGTLSGPEDLRVLGRVRGQVAIEGQLEIGSEGIVEAEVKARRVIVHGVVVGSVEAVESIALETSARVVGPVSAPSLKVALGAQLAGKVNAGRLERIEQVEAEPAPAPPARLPTAAPVALPEEPERTRRSTKRVALKKLAAR